MRGGLSGAGQLRSRGAITEYQSDSSSKRPRLSVAFAVRGKVIDTGHSISN